MICESCKKESKQLRADWDKPIKERIWQCDKCYFPKRKLKSKKK